MTQLSSKRRPPPPAGVGVGGGGGSMLATYPVDDVHQVLITKGVDGLEIERGQSKKVCFVFV